MLKNGEHIGAFQTHHPAPLAELEAVLQRTEEDASALWTAYCARLFQKLHEKTPLGSQLKGKTGERESFTRVAAYPLAKFITACGDPAQAWVEQFEAREKKLIQKQSLAALREAKSNQRNQNRLLLLRGPTALSFQKKAPAPVRARKLCFFSL